MWDFIQYDVAHHNRDYADKQGMWFVTLDEDRSLYLSVDGEAICYYANTDAMRRLGFHPSREAAEQAAALYALKHGG